MIGRVGRVARRLAWPVVATVVLAVVLGVGVVPTRSYLDRKQQVVNTEERLGSLEEANRQAKSRVEALQSDAEIERLAREQYGLVKEGEEPYRILPEPQQTVQIPPVWPFERL